MTALTTVEAINIIMNINSGAGKVCSFHETPVIPHDPSNNDGFDFDMQNLFIVYKIHSSYFCRVYNSFTIPGVGCKPNYLMVHKFELPVNIKINCMEQLRTFKRA